MNGRPAPTNPIGMQVFWRSPVRAEGAALMRISLACVMLVELLTGLAPRLDAYLEPGGLLPLSAAKGWLGETGHFSLLARPEWMSGPAAAKILFGVWVAALVGMMLGICTRTCTVVVWVLAVSFHNRLPWVTNGGDRMFRIGVFFLMFSRCGAAWSLDALWSRRRCAGDASASLIPPWPLRLMQIQLGAMYLFGGLSKLLSPPNWAENDWLNGNAVYWVLNDLCLPRFPHELLPVPLALLKLASWGTILLELSWTPFVLWPRTRPWMLAAGAVFHLLIWAVLEIGCFSPVVVCWYALFFDLPRPASGARPNPNLKSAI